MNRMLLAMNAVLYVVALTMSLCVLTPVPAEATRRMRAARLMLAGGGGAAITGAITLMFIGMWFESAIVGCGALVLVCICLWVALSHPSSDRDDGEDGSDGGGGRPRRPIPPAPPEPLGGPDADWGEFDKLRAGWARDRDFIGV